MIFAHLPLAFFLFLSSRHSAGVFSSRGGWRGACQNECDAGGTSRLASKNHVAYYSRVAPLLVCASPSLYSSCSLPRPSPPCLRVPAVVAYTWRTTVLYVALQDAFSRSSSPYPFSINARRRRLSATSRGTSLETRVCSCAERKKKKSGSINEIVRAARTSRRHRSDLHAGRFASVVFFTSDVIYISQSESLVPS